MTTRSELRWSLLAGMALNGLVIGVLLGLAAHPEARRMLLDPALSQSHGPALIGGPFELIAQDGRTVTNRTFHGRPMIVTFGYIGEPDLTPATLQTLTAALDRLGPAENSVAALFISLDPRHDTPAKLKEYLANFHPRLIGLTGSEMAIAAVAKSYRLPLERTVDAAVVTSATIVYEPLIYLMNRRGEYVTHLSHETGVEEVVKAIRHVL